MTNAIEVLRRLSERIAQDIHHGNPVTSADLIAWIGSTVLDFKQNHGAPTITDHGTHVRASFPWTKPETQDNAQAGLAYAEATLRGGAAADGSVRLDGHDCKAILAELDRMRARVRELEQGATAPG